MDFDLIASEYARHRKIMLPVLDGLRDFVAAIGHKAAVVELGSGTGNYIIALAESTGCMAWGIDCAKGMLAQAVSRGSEVQFAIVERIGHTVRVTNAAAYAAKARGRGGTARCPPIPILFRAKFHIRQSVRAGSAPSRGGSRHRTDPRHPAGADAVGHEAVSVGHEAVKRRASARQNSGRQPTSRRLAPRRVKSWPPT